MGTSTHSSKAIDIGGNGALTVRPKLWTKVIADEVQYIRGRLAIPYNIISLQETLVPTARSDIAGIRPRAPPHAPRQRRCRQREVPRSYRFDTASR